MSNAETCPRCDRLLMGSARTCLVHGDQLDIGGRTPALETVADQLRRKPLDRQSPPAAPRSTTG